jgi:hypothetical protein
MLEDFKLIDAAPPTEGRDPNTVLTDVFDVPLRPKDVEDEIGAIAELIDEEKLVDAKTRLEQLGNRLGESDSDVNRLRTMIELLSA